MNKKILYIFDASDWESRIEVARNAKKEGFNVVIALINGNKKNDIDKFKITSLNYNGLSSFTILFHINKVIREEKPDIIHCVTLKYSFITGISSFPFKNIRNIYTLAGLGYLFRSDELKSIILRKLLKLPLTTILKRNKTTVIFQNSDDLNLMVNNKYVDSQNTVLIKGSGIYINRYKAIPSSKNNGLPIVLMPTRLVHEKGISVFIKTAKILQKRGINAKFQIAGGETKHNPRAISAKDMNKMIKNSNVEWLGRVENMPDLLSKASLIVYPSYYGEGIPRVLLESCAAGRAIVTTDHAGCREAVEHGRNGLLVEVKNPEQTADAIYELLTNHDRRKAMEIQSRQRAKQEFDIYIIAKQTSNIYNNSIS